MRREKFERQSLSGKASLFAEKNKVFQVPRLSKEGLGVVLITTTMSKDFNRKEQKATRKALRNNATSAESFLWNHLKGKQLEGKKFRRQHGIEKYIVDFYCPEEKLVVELDGEQHFNPSGEANDIARTEYLNSLEIKVIRFENKMVFEQIDFVLEEIKKNFG